jgi:hypothetical protein
VDDFCCPALTSVPRVPDCIRGYPSLWSKYHLPGTDATYSTGSWMSFRSGNQSLECTGLGILRRTPLCSSYSTPSRLRKHYPSRSRPVRLLETTWIDSRTLNFLMVMDGNEVLGSVAAGLWRILLMPIDTVKTSLQVRPLHSLLSV